MQLKNKAISVGIWSENYKKLAKWYIDVLNFTVKEQAELPDDSYIAFDFGVEFYVDSVVNTYNELKEKEVVIIAEPFAEPTSTGNWCMAIADPEGNILQFYGKK